MSRGGGAGDDGLADDVVLIADEDLLDWARPPWFEFKSAADPSGASPRPGADEAWRAHVGLVSGAPAEGAPQKRQELFA